MHTGCACARIASRWCSDAGGLMGERVCVCVGIRKNKSISMWVKIQNNNIVRACLCVCVCMCELCDNLSLTMRLAATKQKKDVPRSKQNNSMWVLSLSIVYMHQMRPMMINDYRFRNAKTPSGTGGVWRYIGVRCMCMGGCDAMLRNYLNWIQIGYMAEFIRHQISVGVVFCVRHSQHI